MYQYIKHKKYTKSNFRNPVTFYVSCTFKNIYVLFGGTWYEFWIAATCTTYENRAGFSLPLYHYLIGLFWFDLV